MDSVTIHRIESISLETTRYEKRRGNGEFFVTTVTVVRENGREMEIHLFSKEALEVPPAVQREES